MVIVRIETERLLLRPLTVDDAPATFALDHGEGVNDFTGDTPSETVEDEHEWLLETCRLAVIERATGDLVGWCGLEDNELGYRFRRESWGKGYATEAARAVVEQAMAAGVTLIVASVDERNGASKRVLEKLGFVCTEPGWYELRMPVRATG